MDYTQKTADLSAIKTIPITNDNVEILVHNLVQEELDRQHMKWEEAIQSAKRHTLAMALLMSGSLSFAAGLLDWLTDGNLSGIASSMLTVGLFAVIAGLISWYRHRETEQRKLIHLDDSGEVTKEDFSHIRCLS